MYRLIFALALVGMARGDTISFANSLSFSNWQNGMTLSLPQFDPNLGTLTGVDLHTDARVGFKISYDTVDPPASCAPGDFCPPGPTEADYGVRMGFSEEIAGVGDQTPISHLVGIINAPGSETRIVLEIIQWNLTKNLGTFIGPGTWGITFSVFNGLETDARSPRVHPPTITTLTQSLNLFSGEYVYTPNLTPVPEPSTFALVGLVLVGMLLHGNRARSASPDHHAGV